MSSIRSVYLILFIRELVGYAEFSKNAKKTVRKHINTETNLKDSYGRQKERMNTRWND